MKTIYSLFLGTLAPKYKATIFSLLSSLKAITHYW